MEACEGAVARAGGSPANNRIGVKGGGRAGTRLGGGRGRRGMDRLVFMEISQLARRFMKRVICTALGSKA